MSLTNLLNRPITIIRRDPSASEDAYGNEVPNSTPVDVVGELQQQRRDEPDTQGETSDTRWLLILPAGTEINTGDAVQVDGQRYEMVGDPWPARNPRTRVESHLECTLRRTDGSEDVS